MYFVMSWIYNLKIKKLISSIVQWEYKGTSIENYKHKKTQMEDMPMNQILGFHLHCCEWVSSVLFHII